MSPEHKELCILMLLSLIILFFAHQIGSHQSLFVDVGREGDECYVEGFYQRESSEGFNYRWTTDSSTIRFPDTGYMPVRISLAMDGARPEGQSPPNVTVTANGEIVADFVALNGIRAYEFDCFPSSFPFPRDLLLEIKAQTFVPTESNDSRTLGLLVNSVEIRPIYGSLSFPSLLVSLEVALAGTVSVFLCYLVLQRMRIWRWVSLGSCGLLAASLILNIPGRFVASRLVITFLPLSLLASYGVVILVGSFVSLLRNWDWRARSVAVLNFKRNLPNLLLAFLSTLLTLFAIEIGFRVKVHLENQRTLHQVLKSELELPAEGPVSFAHLIRLSRNPQIIYELKPNLSVIWEDNSVTLNEEGFRSGSYSVQTSGDIFRIVGIGDSKMFGMGVSDGEQYLARLENQLNQTLPGRRWEVINTAVPGYSTVMEVETLREKGLKYKPDIVIIEFCSNDLSLPYFIRREESPFTTQKSFLVEFVSERLGYSQYAGELDPLIRKLREIGLVRGPRKENEWDYEDDPSKVPPQYQDMVGWDAYVKAMNELKIIKEKHGFDVIVISQDPEDYTLKRQALELSAELGFHVIDVGPALNRYMQQNGIRKYGGSPLTISKTDRHPSALGHKIAAEELFGYLVREHLIDQ